MKILSVNTAATATRLIQGRSIATGIGKQPREMRAQSAGRARDQHHAAIQAKAVDGAAHAAPPASAFSAWCTSFFAMLQRCTSLGPS